MRKKIDSRIRTLIENNVMTNNRSFFVIVGDKGKDQVVNLHYMLSKAAVKARPSVLWCYKKELGFSSHRQKRMKQIKKQIQRGLVDPDKDDPFELFISSTNIRYCYYKETHKILGNTFGMCVLQDFEALTPNILARTIETVEGGGIVVLLLRTMKSLKQLYTMSMDVHDRYRTEAHQDVVARFNERFILSLANCESCMILDEELNVLPISSKANSIVPLPPKDSTDLTPEEKELKEIQKSLEDTPIIGPLVKNSKTTDQAKALLTFVEAISDKNLKTTVALTAGRGRGKSAALGLAIASAVANGYSNIFVTSPSPENLKTLFEFIFKGFDALGYEEHLDYDIIQSTNPDFNKAVVRVNIFREHRQTIQYIQPQDSQVLGQAELVVIDEAAAIPLPLVKALLGPYLIFMASTINGYEGTGRSLSLKLIQQLRESSVGTSVNQSEIVNKSELDAKKSIGGRILREVKLEEPIRYGKGDIVEKWLNELLCLDSTVVPRISSGYPHPSECELYYVNRDTLFSYHKASESFLQRLVSLYVASHYKNSPNDLQLLSDAPAHHIFVLLPPVDETSNSLPEILAVVQVALEGEISKESVMAGLSRGERASGDLIPWTISQQFQDENFGSLSGGRVVRIAAHPDYQKMGYGSRCLEILKDYYEGKFMNLSEDTKSKGSKAEKEKDTDKFDLHSEVLAPRKNLPPLLVKLSDRPAEQLDYLGVSFGLTENLYRFWKRAGYVPVYLRQTNNELTGEYSCIMLNALSNKRENPFRSVSPDWLELYWTDFERRFVNLLSYEFRKFSPVLSMEILSRGLSLKGQAYEPLTKEELAKKMSTYDLKRIDAYIKNMADYHLVIDLLPEISSQYFLHKFGNEVSLSPVQQTILGALGLQRKTVDEVEKELSLPSVQILALFSKVIRKIAQFYESLEKGSSSSSKTGKDETKEEPKKEVFKKTNWEPLEKTLDEELDETESQEKQKLKEEQKKLLQTLNLDQYAIPGDEEEWNMALKNKTAAPTSVSIKNPNSQKLKRGLEKPTTNQKEQKPDNKKQKKSKK